MYRNLVAAPAYLALAFCTAALLIPAHADTPGAASLAYKFTPGEVLRYQMTMDIKGGSSISQMTSRISMLVTATVESVDAKTGDATLSVGESGLKSTTTLNGRPFSMPGAEASSATQAARTVTVSPLGAPVLVAADAQANDGSDAPDADKPPPASANGSMETSSIMPGTGGFDDSGLGLGGPFPNHPIQVGDVWRFASGFGAFATGREYQKESLVALSRSGGHTVANLGDQFSMTATPKAPGTIEETTHSTGIGSEQFDVTSGTLLASAVTVTIMSKDPPRAGSRSDSGSKDAFKTSMVTTTQMRLIQQTMPQSSGQTR